MSDAPIRYALVELPLNLMQPGDIFMNSSEEWFLVVRIDRMNSTITLAWADNVKEDIPVPYDRIFKVLQPEGYFLAKTSLKGSWE